VAKCVICDLEPIEVDPEDCKVLLVAPRASERLIDAIAKQYAVCQAGEGVVVRHMDDLVGLYLQLARPLSSMGFTPTEVVPNTVKSYLVTNAKRDCDHNQKRYEDRYGDIHYPI
jgi:hypothetical protein